MAIPQWQTITPNFSGSNQAMSNAQRGISSAVDTISNMQDRFAKEKQVEQARQDALAQQSLANTRADAGLTLQQQAAQTAKEQFADNQLLKTTEMQLTAEDRLRGDEFRKQQLLNAAEESKLTAANRAAQLGIQQAQFGLQKDKYARDIAKEDAASNVAGLDFTVPTTSTKEPALGASELEALRKEAYNIDPTGEIGKGLADKSDLVTSLQKSLADVPLKVEKSIPFSSARVVEVNPEVGNIKDTIGAVQTDINSQVSKIADTVAARTASVEALASESGKPSIKPKTAVEYRKSLQEAVYAQLGDKPDKFQQNAANAAINAKTAEYATTIARDTEDAREIGKAGLLEQSKMAGKIKGGWKQASANGSKASSTDKLAYAKSYLMAVDSGILNDDDTTSYDKAMETLAEHGVYHDRPFMYSDEVIK